MKRLIRNTIYIITGVILLNVISFFLFARIDFTANNRYSLSKVSKNIIRNTVEPITVDFYVSENLPQEHKKLAKEFHYLLKEYNNLGNNNITINVIHPDTDENKLKAFQAGIAMVNLEYIEKDMVRIQETYMGAVFKIGDKQALLPYISPDTPLEYEITRILRQAYDTIKPRVGFIRGHQEIPLNLMSRFINELSHLSDISIVDLQNSSLFDKYDVLCIIAPKETYTPYELGLLEQYLKNGGRLFIAIDHAIGIINEHQNSGFVNDTGLEGMLRERGLKINDDFVVDFNCGLYSLRAQYDGLFNIRNTVNFPYFPVISNFSKHTITQGLNGILLPFASSIEQVKTSYTYVFTPLARSSSMSGVKKAPLSFDLQKQWRQHEFNKPDNIVAALMTNSDYNSAIVTISDADFMLDNVGTPDNTRFAINSVEWLADNTGLIQLRNKYTTFASLQPITETTKNFLKYFNFLLPVIATVVIAAIHFRRKRIKRLKRMQTGYVD